MRHILPYLQKGHDLYNAQKMAGYADFVPEPLEVLPLLLKNSLRQPVVEKILNQMINLVNEIVKQMGKPDEIRIELARELKQSSSERERSHKNNIENEKANKVLATELKEHKIKISTKNIKRLKIYSELQGECLYCGEKIELKDWLNSNEDIEHILPKSKFFDDSFANNVPSHRTCNKDKGNKTAFDFMSGKSAAEFERYKTKVSELYKGGKGIISKTKYDRLMTKEADIPQDFINRQLKETQYIAKKAKEILMQLCPYQVWATSGSVTQILRHLWGYDEVLMQLQLPKYREHGKTKMVQYTKNEQVHEKEIIYGWSKRDDQRHHAIDALVIACTKQMFITTINTLSQTDNRASMQLAVNNHQFSEKFSLLQKYIIAHKPFETKAVADVTQGILVSYKPSLKLSSKSTRYIQKNGKPKAVQHNILVPRGALHEETVYGKIKQRAYKEVKIDKHFGVEKLAFVTDKKIKQLLTERLAKYGNDPEKAFVNLKKEPLTLGTGAQAININKAPLYEMVDTTVVKYDLSSLKEKDLEYVIDKGVRNALEKHLKAHKNNVKKAFGDAQNPVWLNKEKGIQIKTVRMDTGLKTVVPIRYNEAKEAIGFAKTGSNHHLAMYKDENGKLVEHICTFWHAVQRKLCGFGGVVRNPAQLWEHILQQPKDTYNQDFLDQLPLSSYQYQMCLHQNEMVVIGMTKTELEDAIAQKNHKAIAKYLYRVQSLSSLYYSFRHQYETKVNDEIPIDPNEQIAETEIIEMEIDNNDTDTPNEATTNDQTDDAASSPKEKKTIKDTMYFKATKRLIRIQSIESFVKQNVLKVKIDAIGNIHLAN